jgi:oligopeptide/dipeptide ABC transporter ATP-binding protein
VESEINDTILSVRDLRTQFSTDGGIVRAADKVSFDLKKGETLAIVGESGSGKSATALSILRLIEPEGGEVVFDGKDLLHSPISEVRKIRGRRISMIFQDPSASLNPYMTIGDQMVEMTRLHLGFDRREAREHAIKMLEAVGIPDAHVRIDAHPHEFSGGMRQRSVIAMALSCDPEILIADEPTTALDVTIQAQILELIREVKESRGMSVIVITHDLGVVAGVADRVIVMYAGSVFEESATEELFRSPANPYTVGLLKSTPDPGNGNGELYQIPGSPPNLADLPPGCPFSDRCERAEEVCRSKFPPFVEVSPGHRSLCHFAGEVYAAQI